ncbi:MAG: hypothetical protein OEQ24_09985 [Gammaproteobacteria bacterium]|nr:hypothetical protein [Gammaproteobacteria bacterium]
MKMNLMSMVLVVTASIFPAVSMSGHNEGEETNVVVLVCVIDQDKPHRIHVRSISVNTTQNPIPMVSTKTTCAQALHELMTAGFEITKSDLENYFVFVLTRIDQSRQKH